MPSTYPTTVWDGTSESRPTPSVFRAPDADDYRQLVMEVIAIQTQLLILGISAVGVLPTADPLVAGQLWASAGTVTVSSG